MTDSMYPATPTGGRHRRSDGFTVGRRAWLAVAATVALGGAGFGLVPLPAAASDGVPAGDANTSAAVAMRAALGALAVAAEVNDGFDRDLFHYGVDEDADGCDTRSEVLLAEASTAPSVTGDCDISGGRWTSYYDGVSYGDKTLVEVDHLVPLAEAWRSGGYRWSAQKRQSFANDLGDARTLVVAGDAVNQDKGGKDIAHWQPPAAAARCRYLQDWVAVKTRWQLSVDEQERAALYSLATSCADTPPAAVAVAAAGDGSAFQQAALGTFVGTWHVHGETVEIRSDKTGTTTWNAGPCHVTTDPAEPLCKGTATFTVVEQGGGLAGAYDSVTYSQWRGPAVADYDDLGEGPRVGHTFTLTQIADGVLYRTHNPEIVLGNPYLCGPTASAEWLAKC